MRREGLKKTLVKKNEEKFESFALKIDRKVSKDELLSKFNFIKNIEGLDKEIYLNFAYDIEGYKIEPLIFSNQKDNYQHYKIKTIEKVW